jgi:hypothetical protein
MKYGEEEGRSSWTVHVHFYTKVERCNPTPVGYFSLCSVIRVPQCPTNCCKNMYTQLNRIKPITVVARSKAWTVFARSNTGIVGSNPTWRMDVCVRLLVFVLSCVQVAALRQADPPFKKSYRLCKRLRNWKIGQGSAKGCRAIDR